MNIPGTEIGRKTAEALVASNMDALATLLPSFPPRMAEALAATATSPALPLPPLCELPDGIDCVADSRFVAIFARKHAIVRWSRPGRELTTGCYLTPGSNAEFILNPGEWRFILLAQPGDHA